MAHNFPIFWLGRRILGLFEPAIVKAVTLYSYSQMSLLNLNTSEQSNHNHDSFGSGPEVRAGSGDEKVFQG